MRRAFILVLLLASCGATFAGVPQGSELPQQLKKAEQLWKTQGPRNYRYTIENKCFLCGPQVEVTVINGKCVSATPKSKWPEITCDGRTIPELLRKISAWVEDTSDSTIEVTFDAHYGYPVACFIRTNMEHDSAGYSIKRFTVSR